MALSTNFTQCAPEATEFGEITQNKGHFAVQGHSRSPTFELVAYGLGNWTLRVLVISF